MPTVAVIGASGDRAKFGNKAVRAHLAAGYAVTPIHPTLTEVEGLPAYARLADAPAKHFDRVTLYVPPAVGLTLVDDLAAASIGELLLNPGTASPELLAALQSRGLPVVQGCSILAVGRSPGEFR